MSVLSTTLTKFFFSAWKRGGLMSFIVSSIKPGNLITEKRKLVKYHLSEFSKILLDLRDWIDQTDFPRLNNFLSNEKGISHA